ncbi:hypothetical protein SCAR479_05182 [Seiridium cardinale]|uniref:Uncharacterized protein n=1 Tax=Seiridium cardinale TaxID=138064 RepID=A0ABR2XWQ9_9PEZI
MNRPLLFVSPIRLGPSVCRHRPALLSSAFSGTNLTPHPALPQHRSLHIGPYIEAGFQVAQDAIISLHSTGLPWAVTIPLVAIGVNLATRLPFNIYSHLIIHRRSKVAPVLQGWYMRFWRDVGRENSSMKVKTERVEKRAKAQTKKIYRALGLQQWKMYFMVLGIPIWIASFQLIGRLCGWSRFDHLVGASGSNGAHGTPATETGTALEVLPDGSKSITSAAHDLASQAMDPTATTALSHAAAQTTGALTPLDPALTSEGILWFTDLTAVDPYNILPICFTALTIINIIPKDETARAALFPHLNTFLNRHWYKREGAQSQPQSQDLDTVPSTKTVQSETNWRVRLIRVILVSSPGLFVFTSSFPAGVHLYTLTSLLATMATRAMLSRRLPILPRAKDSKYRETPALRPKIPKKDEMN